MCWCIYIDDYVGGGKRKRGIGEFLSVKQRARNYVQLIFNF